MLHLISLMSLLLIWQVQGHAQIEANVLLSSQQEVDQFANEDLDTIFGNLTISGASITNLKALDGLTHVEGYLLLRSNIRLINLEGLDSLATIGSALIIQNNDRLKNMEGLGNLEWIGGIFTLERNLSLVNLRGLTQLKAIAGGLTFLVNQSLEDFTGLDSLSDIGDNLDLCDNPQLLNFKGLDNLREIGGSLYVYNSSSLINLDGLNKLQIVKGELDIAKNPILEDLDGLVSLETIGECFYIFGNGALTSIEGLEALQHLGGTLTVIRNELLDACSVMGLCNYLQDPPGSVSIWENGETCSTVADFTDFCTLTAQSSIVSSRFQIYPNPFRTTLNITTEYPGLYRCRIYDHLGILRFQQDLVSDEVLNLNHLAQGSYLLNVQHGVKSYSRQILKLK